MKNIEKFNLIVYSDKGTFTYEVSRVVREYQENMLEIEIQYAPIEDCFSALIIGRKDC